MQRLASNFSIPSSSNAWGESSSPLSSAGYVKVLRNFVVAIVIPKMVDDAGQICQMTALASAVVFHASVPPES